MTAPQQLGREFEDDLALEFGLDVVPGSGNQWHSKLDLQGNEARWSLKFTLQNQFPLTYNDLVEAIKACEGTGGDGAMPLWAVRFGVSDDDFIILRKDDFKRLAAGELELVNEAKPKAAQRKAKARVPRLLRNEDD